MTTCTNHCSPCNGHFHSLKAFDAHHTHDASGWPICHRPWDLGDRFMTLTENGECRVYANATQRGVTIWTLPQDLEETRAAFAVLGERCKAKTGVKAEREP